MAGVGEPQSLAVVKALRLPFFPCHDFIGDSGSGVWSSSQQSPM